MTKTEQSESFEKDYSKYSYCAVTLGDIKLQKFLDSTMHMIILSYFFVAEIEFIFYNEKLSEIVILIFFENPMNDNIKIILPNIKIIEVFESKKIRYFTDVLKTRDFVEQADYSNDSTSQDRDAVSMRSLVGGSKFPKDRHRNLLDNLDNEEPIPRRKKSSNLAEAKLPSNSWSPASLDNLTIKKNKIIFFGLDLKKILSLGIMTSFLAFFASFNFNSSSLETFGKPLLFENTELNQKACAKKISTLGQKKALKRLGFASLTLGRDHNMAITTKVVCNVAPPTPPRMAFGRPHPTRISMSSSSGKGLASVISYSFDSKYLASNPVLVAILNENQGANLVPDDKPTEKLFKGVEKVSLFVSGLTLETVCFKQAVRELEISKTNLDALTSAFATDNLADAGLVAVATKNYLAALKVTDQEGMKLNQSLITRSKDGRPISIDGRRIIKETKQLLLDNRGSNIEGKKARLKKLEEKGLVITTSGLSSFQLTLSSAV